MADKVRIGFIGAGGIAVGHAMRLHDGGLAEIVALSDPSDGSVARMRERRPELAGVPVFADYRDMLAQVPLDAVEIHSPHVYHTRQILDSLTAGKHVLCEKPMTSSVADAKAVIAKRDETGKVLGVSYQRHFSPMYRYIRDQICTSALGSLQTVTVIMAQDWITHQRGAWRSDPAISCGGQLNDSGSHLVDMLLWCTSMKAVEVFAKINSFDCQVDVDSAITVRFANGAIGNLTILGSAPQGFWELFGAWGSKGSLIYDMKSGLREQFFGGDEHPLAFTDAASDPDTNFVRAILGQEPLEIPAECGLRVIELTEAAWRSAQSGKPVLVEEM
ncbi:MAG: Gfo/Idh/MocA family protein [Anaerolineae bacterium]